MGRPWTTLDFDIETLAAGYADPEWVPHTVTAWATWDGSQIRSDALAVADLFDIEKRADFVRPLVEQVLNADILTGHNLLRFDLPVLMAEAMRLGLPLLKPVLVQDTMRIPRTRGFKKGQDNLGDLLRVSERKRSMNWQEWQDAYADPTLAAVLDRVESDVRQHVQIRNEMLWRGWLKPPRMWRP